MVPFLLHECLFSLHCFVLKVIGHDQSISTTASDGDVTDDDTDNHDDSDDEVNVDTTSKH